MLRADRTQIVALTALPLWNAALCLRPRRGPSSARYRAYTVGGNRFEGAEKIRAFYARRRQHGTITTRHFVGIVQVFREGEHAARVVGVMTLYRADGYPPIER